MSKFLRRLGVGAVLILVVLAAIYFHYLPLALLIIAWSFLAGREFTALLNRQGIGLPGLLIPVVNLIYPVLYVFLREVGKTRPASPGMEAVLIPMGIVALYSLVAKPPRGPKLAFSAFAVLYLSILPFYAVLLRVYAYEHLAHAFAVVLYPLLVTWINDTGAYLFGKWLGRHKLSPEISPNKTWEGFIAGLVVSVVFSTLYLPSFLPPVNRLEAGLLGLVLGVAAQVGDLVESIFKREAGVKDSSSSLAEHGGFLDRADSLLFVVPLFFYYLT
jgi:phosphatidate cytidylyltransferase